MEEKNQIFSDKVITEKEKYQESLKQLREEEKELQQKIKQLENKIRILEEAPLCYPLKDIFNPFDCITQRYQRHVDSLKSYEEKEFKRNCIACQFDGIYLNLSESTKLKEKKKTSRLTCQIPDTQPKSGRDIEFEWIEANGQLQKKTIRLILVHHSKSSIHTQFVELLQETSLLA